MRAVIAKSYVFIHKRNLVNEALPFLLIKDDEFYALCQEDDELEVDLRGTVLHKKSGKRFAAESTSSLIHALTAEGGLVPAIKRHGQGVFATLSK